MHDIWFRLIISSDQVLKGGKFILEKDLNIRLLRIFGSFLRLITNGYTNKFYPDNRRQFRWNNPVRFNLQLDNNRDSSAWDFTITCYRMTFWSQNKILQTWRFGFSLRPIHFVFTDPKTGKNVESNTLIREKESVNFSKFRLRFFQVEWLTPEPRRISWKPIPVCF